MMRALAGSAETLFARGLFSLPTSIHRRLARGGPIVVDGLTLHPELQLLVALRKARGAKSMMDGDVAQARRRFRREIMQFEGARLPVGGVSDRAIETDAGRILVRHYRPPSGRRAPLLVYLHGGGFVVGDLETADIICRRLCKQSDVHVLSVDYRLAPEHPFPAAVDDALAAFTWALANAASLGADPARVAIGGDSAGAHLSAVVTQERARRGDAQPAAQLLLYPATCRRRVRSSLELFAEGFMLERKEIDHFQRQYEGAQTDGDIRLRPFDGLAPEHGVNVPLAPALVVTAGFDPLRDEGEDYAHKLRAHGTHAELRRFDGLVHGFANVACVSRACRRALDDVAADLKRILDTQP